MTTMFDVACVGILVADVIAKPIDDLPDRGKLMPVGQITLHTGGCAANAAVDLARLGLHPALIGKIGRDGFGGFMLDALQKEDVNTDGLVVKDGSNTSASIVFVASGGERTFLHCMGSNAELIAEDINFDLIKQAKILFVAGTYLMPKFDGAPCAGVLKRAKEAGIYTALDTAWDATGRWMELAAPCLPYLDLFMPSYDEARAIAGQDEVERIADVFLSAGAGLATIKLGAQGCFIKSRQGEKHNIPAYTGIEVRDATGAGDAFAAGFLAGLTQGWDLRQCGKFANAVGAHCVMEVGACTGIKKMDEVLRFMQDCEGHK